MANLIMRLGEGTTEFDFLSNTIISAMSGGLGYRLNETKIPLRDGAVIQQANKEMRDIRLDGFIVADTQSSLQSKRDMLEQSLSRMTRQKWRVWDDRFIWVWVQSYMISEITGGAFLSLSWQTQFSANDPYWEAVTPGTIQDSVSIVIANNGNAPSWPTYSITAPTGGLSSATMGNFTTGKSLTWSKSPALAAGLILTINMGDQTVNEAGTFSYLNLAAGDFWSIPPGTNNVTFASTPSGASFTMTWRDRWN